MTNVEYMLLQILTTKPLCCIDGSQLCVSVWISMTFRHSDYNEVVLFCLWNINFSKHLRN